MIKKSKLVAVLFTFLLTLSLAGCGGAQTLESYVNDNKAVQEEIQKSAISNSSYELQINIKENTLIYNFKYKTVLDEELAKQASDTFKANDGTLDATMKNVAKQLEEETEIEGITVKVVYLNGDGKELYTGTYDSK